ncbi:hypothetical protein [Nocardia inohanensis]|uniref:hypothetical protein n=1 Tax=Nocardia inohanensis TaxID=209246 RepID=UPI000AE73CCC|nr:hypothetical protein [Nocardia inohanensis]
MIDTEKTPETTENAEATVEPVVLEKHATAPAAPAPAAAPMPTRETMSAKGFRDRVYPLLIGAAAALAVLATVLGVGWYRAAGDLDTTRTAQADRDRAAEVAKDYTLRSLTYDYKNMPAFFDNVQRGTSEALTKRYNDVHDTLTKIMTEAQVVATGTVVGTSVEAKGNDQYAVTVFATQRTQNIQQAEAATKPNLLTVTVAKSGGEWLVVDYGPKDVTETKGGAAK